jgi:hypothetical protein
MKYLIFIIALLTTSILFAQPSGERVVSVHEDSAVFEFSLSGFYAEAGICWNTTGSPDINDSKVSMTNVSTGTYQFTVTGLTTATRFYFRAYSFVTLPINTQYSKTLTVTKAIWNGSSGTSWTSTSNWDDSRNPESSDIIIITDKKNAPIVSANSSVEKIIIKDDGYLTINNGVTLTVSEDVIIKGASGSSGIVCNGTGALSVTGTSSYERYIPQDDWHLLSIPNNNSSIMQLTGTYINSWDEATHDWSNLTASSSLARMKGYSVRYGTAARTVTFTGAFNNGSLTTTVTNALPSDPTETYGWNLVGNPYPSPIDWDASSGWTRSGVNSTVYVYDASLSTYATFNYSSQTGPFYIPPTQGFYVYATTASSTFGMTNDVRGASLTSYYKKEAEYPIIKLHISNQLKSDETKIIFHPDATDNFETYDGLKLFGWKEDLPQIYSINTEQKLLSINTLNSGLLSQIETPVIVKLGYNTQIETLLTLRVDEIEGFEENINIGVYDHVLNVYQDITNFPYEFTSEIGEFNNRFDLYISKTPNSIEHLNDNIINCYVLDNNLIINTKHPLQNGKILVYDILGRPIINKSLTTKTKHIFTIPEKTNIFVVNIIENETISYRKTLGK